MTLGEAAKQSGFSKATLSRAIRDGKLSAERSLETNSFKIDPAELHRYSEAMQVVRNTAETEREERTATHSSNSKKGDETDLETRMREVREHAELEARAKLAEARLADMKVLLDEMKQQRDKWEQQAERAMRMLAAPKPAEPQAVIPMPAPEAVSQPTAAETRGGWWPFKRSA
jgi:excisionase family DNA binding protein